MRDRSAAVFLAAMAVLPLGACGGSGGRGVVDTQPPPYARQGQGVICGDELAKVMQQRYVSPNASTGERQRAQATLEAIAASRFSSTPVCARRTLRGVLSGRARH
jgi:hypothetical protein